MSMTYYLIIPTRVGHGGFYWFLQATLTAAGQKPT